MWGGWGCEVSCGGHHRPTGKTTTGSALDGAVFDIAQILAYQVHNMSRSQLYLGFYGSVLGPCAKKKLTRNFDIVTRNFDLANSKFRHTNSKFRLRNSKFRLTNSKFRHS